MRRINERTSTAAAVAAATAVTAKLIIRKLGHGIQSISFVCMRESHAYCFEYTYYIGACIVNCMSLLKPFHIPTSQRLASHHILWMDECIGDK